MKLLRTKFKRQDRNLFAPLFTATLSVLTLTTWVQVEAVGEEKAGQKWPANHRVSYAQIDHSVYDRLLKKYVDNNGMVNYRNWYTNTADRAELKNYLAELGKADESKHAGKSEKLAYWINAYNALTIEGILRVYPTTSIRNHTAKLIGYNIWKNLKLTTGGQEVSLEQIEHQILRKMNEPRIHFAIVCASMGCPRLLNEAYLPDRLESQLVSNTRDFFSRPQNLRVDAHNKKLLLSSILTWFGSDFGKSKIDQLRYIAPYFPDDAKRLVSAGGYRIEFQKYDWDLNTQN